MIDPDKRTAIVQLYREGRGKREIARLLGISRNTVRNILKTEGNRPILQRKDATRFNEERLRQLHQDCKGRIQRMHEILQEKDRFDVGYSTLSRKLREMGLGNPPKNRCERVPDTPGEEMQHDTTVYFLTMGSQKIKVIASLLYFRYSKVRYLKFYRNFDRFRMQCFLHEALMHYGYCAGVCIIDNTNLARLSGSGSRAVIAGEMERFSGRYGFRFVCHALNHPNRKAGNERGFFTVETNFFPGRTFATMEELNRSAFRWSTERLYHRPVGKAGVIPAKAFEVERSFLQKVPEVVEPPYRDHQRLIDQYGYAAFAGNYYWVPGTGRETVTLLEYDQSLKIYHRKELLVSYDLPDGSLRNRIFFPDGCKKPPCRPKNRKNPTQREENSLRSLSPVVDDYFTWVFQRKGVSRHSFIRKLYGLHLKLAPVVFLKTIERAHQYRITDTGVLEQISALLIRQSGYQMPEVDVDRDFYHRKAYIEGRTADPVDLSCYDDLLKESYHE